MEFIMSNSRALNNVEGISEAEIKELVRSHTRAKDKNHYLLGEVSQLKAEIEELKEENKYLKTWSDECWECSEMKGEIKEGY